MSLTGALSIRSNFATGYKAEAKSASFSANPNRIPTLMPFSSKRFFLPTQLSFFVIMKKIVRSGFCAVLGTSKPHFFKTLIAFFNMIQRLLENPNTVVL